MENRVKRMKIQGEKWEIIGLRDVYIVQLLRQPVRAILQSKYWDNEQVPAGEITHRLHFFDPDTGFFDEDWYFIPSQLCKYVTKKNIFF